MSFVMDSERQTDSLHTLQTLGRCVAIELKDIEAPQDNPMSTRGLMPRKGWLNQLLHRQSEGIITVDGWGSPDSDEQDDIPIFLSGDGEIYVRESEPNSHGEIHVLSEQHIRTINAARAIQNSLHRIEERYDLHEKLRAKHQTGVK